MLTATGKNGLVGGEFLQTTLFDTEGLRTGPAGSAISMARVGVRGWGLLFVVVSGGRVFFIGICRIRLSSILGDSVSAGWPGDVSKGKLTSTFCEVRVTV